MHCAIASELWWAAEFSTRIMQTGETRQLYEFPADVYRSSFSREKQGHHEHTPKLPAVQPLEHSKLLRRDIPFTCL